MEIVVATPPYVPPPPNQYGSQAGSASGLAIAALICGILSWVGGSFLAAIPAIICGKIELGKIKRGETSEAGKVFAQIGFWAGLSHVIFAAAIFLFVCVLQLVGVGVFALLGLAGAASG